MIIDDKLEKGKQIGIRKRIKKGSRYYWYSYAIQKVGDQYIAYENEIAEDNMAMEIDEYENVYQFHSLTDCKNHIIPYDIAFGDLNTLKGCRIFRPDLYYTERK